MDTTGGYNTAIGHLALEADTGGQLNTAVGDRALNTNTSGVENTAVGAIAMESNDTGSYNTASGYFSMLDNSSGGRNSAYGVESLEFNTTGSFNSAIGERALRMNSTGNDNTGVGAGALKTSNGTKLTCIGYLCSARPKAAVNATAIGSNSMVTTSNSVVLGSVAGINGATTTARVGIGTTAPTSILTIGRGEGHPLSDSWETYSSRRWKTNIQTLPDALGKVEQLRGVSYELKDSGKHEIGVIAEEVGTVVPELVSYEPNGKDARGVDYSRLTALLIEAVKTQQKTIAALTESAKRQRAQIRALRNHDAGLQSRLTKLEGNVKELGQTKSTRDRRNVNGVQVAKSQF